MTTATSNVSALAAKVEALEKRLEIMEDTEKVRECMARYGFNADLGRSMEWVNTWTEKGVYDLGPTRRLQGSDQLLYDCITEPKGHKTIENKSQHMCVNFFIRVDGNKAWAEFYSVVMVRMQVEGLKIVDVARAELAGQVFLPWSCGYNHCEFEKRDGQWYLTLRYRRMVGGDEWGGKVIKSYLKASR